MIETEVEDDGDVTADQAEVKCFSIDMYSPYNSTIDSDEEVEYEEEEVEATWLIFFAIDRPRLSASSGEVDPLADERQG